MSITYGGDKITATDGGSLNPLSAINRNRLIDAGFTINQRVYVSGTALSSGVYAHDRWKAGASGCTYTFTQGSLGVPITITITAGSIQQVIEGCNMPEGGTYVLSWEGTAQARFNGGTYGSSPLAVTGITAGANTTIEFNTGTLLKPQLEVGSSATGFEYRQYQQELALCQRYLPAFNAGTNIGYGVGSNYAASAGTATIPFQVTPRVNFSGISTKGSFLFQIPGVGTYTVSSLVIGFSSFNSGGVAFSGSGMGTGVGYLLGGSADSQILFTGCEL